MQSILILLLVGLIAGFLSGKIASGFLNISTHTVGLSTIKTTDNNAPVTILQVAPSVVKFFQSMDKSKEGKFALAAIANARPKRDKGQEQRNSHQARVNYR